MKRSSSVVDCILEAAASLSAQSQSFSAEDLVVRAWELYPDRFGLQGYAKQYPDSNRVLTKIMGAAGRLRREGLLERTGAKQYRLTAAGIAASGMLSHDSSDDPPQASRRLAGVGRSHISVLRRLLQSQALEKYRAGKDLSFSDVAALFNVSARSSANQFNVRYAEAMGSVRAARSVTEGDAALPGSSDIVSTSQLDEIDALFDFVSRKFEKEIAVIRARTDERYV